jgi:hypothetical protein
VIPSSFLGNRGENLCLEFFVFIRDSLLKPSEALPRTIHAYQNAAFFLGAQITHTTRTRTLLGSRSPVAYIGSFISFEFRTTNNKCMGKYQTSGKILLRLEAPSSCQAAVETAGRPFWYSK